MSEPVELRREIHAAIESAGPFDEDGRDDDGLPERGMLIGWVIVAEWAGTDGFLWLSMNSSDASGRQLPSWRAAGYLHEGLHGDWPRGERGDDG